MRSRFLVVVLVMTAVVAFAFSAGTVSAATTKPADKSTLPGIGILDPQIIMTSHPKYQSTQDQINKIIEGKKQEAKAAADKETDPEKKRQLVKDKEKEAYTESNKLMAPILKDMETAMNNVAAKMKIELVLDKSLVYMGGKDITKDVVDELKKIAK